MVGLSSFLDEHLEISKDKYALTLSKQFKSTSAKSLGYIYVDISINAITDPMQTLDLPDNSYVAVVTQDGRR